MRVTPPDGTPWINPVGGLGDMLLLSGVLRLVSEREPERRFNLIRRTGYLTFLAGHPAIGAVGWPAKGARLVHTSYWAMEPLGPGLQRPFQVLARSFGLPTPVEETLWVPGPIPEDPLLHGAIPWTEANVLIAPASDSPRKGMALPLWERVVEALQRAGCLVVQAGRMGDPHVRPAWCALGLTTPWQLLALVRRCDLVVTSDSFAMHAAHLAGTPAVVLWGPTRPEVYGYPEQVHLRAPGSPCDGCLGSTRNDGGRLYGSPCPRGDGHCVDRLDPDEVAAAALRRLGRG